MGCLAQYKLVRYLLVCVVCVWCYVWCVCGVCVCVVCVCVCVVCVCTHVLWVRRCLCVCTCSISNHCLPFLSQRCCGRFMIKLHCRHLWISSLLDWAPLGPLRASPDPPLGQKHLISLVWLAMSFMSLLLSTRLSPMASPLGTVERILGHI